MPRFNDFFYGLVGAGTGYYGNRAALAFSAEPIVATAVGYDDIVLTWSAPTSDAEGYSAFRIVRNQNGYPQTQEDGFIIYESAGVPDAPTANNPFHDTSLDDAGDIDFPLISGRFVFYRAWLRKDSNSSWVSAGSAFTLLPSPHNLGIARDSRYIETNPEAGVFIGQDRLAFFDPKTSPFVSSTHQRFMDLFPRTITSKSNSSLDVSNNSYQGQTINTSGGLGLATVADTTADSFSDENALFPAFISAFSFTFDEMLTFASLITPDTDIHWSSPTSVLLGSQELGLENDVDTVTATQRRLLRNAVSSYASKGTSPGLEEYCQSATGYDATITDTTNLLFSSEDSTFYLPGWETAADIAEKDGTPMPPVGNWISNSTGLSLRVVSNQVGSSNDDISDPVAGKFVIDTVYCAKVIPSGDAQEISLGVVSPIGTGIPVKEAEFYVLSAYSRTAAEDTSIRAEFRWFDKTGIFIESITPPTVLLTGGDWERIEFAAVTAPAEARYVGVTLQFGRDDIVYLDMLQLEKVASTESLATVYQEPRGAIIDLAPARINLILNPSFSSALEEFETLWTPDSSSSVAISASGGLFGANCLSLTKSDGSSEATLAAGYSNGLTGIPIASGEYYSVSAYIKNVSSPDMFSIGISFIDATDDPIGEWIYSDNTAINTDTWTRLMLNAKAPANAVRAQLIIIADDASDRVTDEVLIDGVMVVKSSGPIDYFDGNSITDGGVWKDGSTEEVSGIYPAKSVRMQRLQKEIREYIGLGTPFYITLFDGDIYYKGIA